jgi:hypothetical protein
MQYSVFFNEQLGRAGFDDLHCVYNCYDVPVDPESGWPLKLPDIEFGPKTLLLLHFQDFVNIRDGRVLELEKVEAKYGANSNRVVVTYWNHGLDQVYSGPVNLIEFSNHNYDICQALSARSAEWLPAMQHTRTRAWQCLNGRTCRHRQRAYWALRDLPNGIVTYGSEHPLPKWDYSCYRGTENDDNFVALSWLYGTTAVNIVTETEYNTAPGIVSEKTLMAFAAGQIPIVIGHAGIVQHCRELGFDMFDDLVNTTYDYMPNEVRVEQAVTLNQDLIMGQRDLEPYRERIQANREHLLEDWPTIMELRFIRDCERLARDLGLAQTD